MALYIAHSTIIAHCQIGKNCGANQVLVDAKLLFETGWQVAAECFILIHSHPSGKVEPSLSDISATEFLSDIGQALELPLLDHYIVSTSTHFSFVEAGLLEPNAPTDSLC